MTTATTTPRISTERSGPVLLIGLNRPDKLNAFDPDMLRELAAAYGELDRDPELRCGVLFAHGDYFTSGLDLPALARHMPAEVASKVTRHVPFVDLFHPLVPRGAIDPWAVTTRPCDKPIVAVVEGPCLTLGIELLLAAQITIAGSDASFQQLEVGRGLFPFGGGTVRWPQVVGANNAYRYLLTAESFNAAEAHRIGLVQEVVEPGQALERAIELAETISRQAPLGIRATLRNVRHSQSHGAESALGRIHRELARILVSKDLRRGFAAFQKRETAQFKGN